MDQQTTNAHFSGKTRNAALNQFDYLMLGAMVVLLVGIVIVILRGDQVGLSVERYSPDKIGSSLATIVITLGEPLLDTLRDSSITLNPVVPGKVTVIGNQISFKPDKPLKPDQSYTVDLSAGIRSAGGRELKQDFRWQFHVAAPRIAYLGPMERSALDVYLLDPSSGQPARQVTTTKRGILSFDIAQDGQSIVYSELQSHGSDSLYLLDLTTLTTRPLHECPDALCTNPIFSPDGSKVSFEKVDMNTGLNIGPGPTRVYVVDVASGQVQPIFSDSQILSYSARWSPDSKTVAVFSVTKEGIVLHDFATGKDRVIHSVQGEVGYFSPDGKRFIYPGLVQAANGNYLRHVMLVDLTSPDLAQRSLVAESYPGDFHQSLWAADSQHVIALVKPFSNAQLSDEKITSIDITTGQEDVLLDEPTHLVNEMVLSPDGSKLLLQRFPVTNPGGAQPELWTFDLTSRELKEVGQNGIFVRWVP